MGTWQAFCASGDPVWFFITVYKTRPLQRLCGTRKSLTVNISNQLSLGRLSSEPGTRLRLKPTIHSVQHVRRHGTHQGSPTGASSSRCCESVTSVIILYSSRDLGLSPWPSCLFSFFDVSIAPCCFLIMCSLLPQGLFTCYS